MLKNIINWLLDLFLRLFSPYPNFKWPTNNQYVTQAFGVNPQHYNQYGLPGHEGIDMRAADGSNITAVWDGEVSRVGWSDGYGNHIRLKHNIRGINYESIYAHFKTPVTLRVGDKVKKGQVVGYADSTGNSTGSHLHFGLKQFNGPLPNTYYMRKFTWPNNFVDPTPFFKRIRKMSD
jgi:murein DD-endopeptidase MepM/ murein hydrolase activator NlpD